MIYVYIYTYMYLYVYTHTHSHTHTHTHTHIYIYVNTYIHTRYESIHDARKASYNLKRRAHTSIHACVQTSEYLNGNLLAGRGAHH